MARRTRAPGLLRNVSFLILGKAAGDIFIFFFFVVITRVFGQEGIGQYSFAMAFTGLFLVAADFGLYNLSIQEMSRLTEAVGAHYSDILTLRLLLSIISLTVLLGLLPCLPFPPMTLWIIALIGTYQVINTLTEGFKAIFIAREDMHLAAYLEFSLKAVTVLLGIAIANSGGRLVTVVAMLPVVTGVYLWVAYGLVARKYGRSRLVASWASLWRKLHEAKPYALSDLLRWLSSRVDVVCLGFFLGAEAAGIYNIAYRIVFLLQVFSYYASIALLPRASKLYKQAPSALEPLYHQWCNLAILVGLPVAAGLWLIGPALIRLFFGTSFSASGGLLRILAWLLFFTCLRSILVVFLMSCDRQVERVKTEWIAAWVNVLGNLILIPILGIRGAAIATLLAEMLIVLLLALQLRTLFRWPPVSSRLLISGGAVLSFCLPFGLLSSLPLGLVVPVSIVLYTGTLMLFREIRETEGRLFVCLVKQGLHRPEKRNDARSHE